MNYWKQFAEMLGVELEQEFSLIKSNGKKLDEYTYKITKNGLYYKAKNGAWCVDAQVTDYILNGKYEVVHKPWKPKNDEKYWYYTDFWGKATECKWINSGTDLMLWKVGNCFKTKEEAEVKGERIIERLNKEYEEGD